MNLSSKFWSALFMVISLIPMTLLGAMFDNAAGDSGLVSGAVKTGDPLPDVVAVDGHPDCKPGLNAGLPEALDGGESMLWLRRLLLPPSCKCCAPAGGGANPGGAVGDPDQECGETTAGVRESYGVGVPSCSSPPKISSTSTFQA